MTDIFFDQEFFSKVLPDRVSIEDIPILAFKTPFVGFTDYLDGIYPKDMEYCVMRGVDCFNRPFLSFTWRTGYEKSCEYCEETGMRDYGQGAYSHCTCDNENVQTFFQRYSDSTGVWSHGKFGIDSIVNCCGNTLRQPEELEKIKVFINDNVGKKRGV